MKKILFSLLILLAIQAEAQYKKLPLDANHYWTIKYTPRWNSNPLNDPTFYYTLKTTATKTFFGKTYKYISCLSPMGGGPPDPLFTGQYIYDDTIAKKVYVIAKDSTEQVLYDFTKKAGDAGSAYDVHKGTMSNYTVSKVDSVKLGDSLYHRRFDMNSATLGVTITVVEGVGSLASLLSGYFSSYPDQVNLSCMGRISPFLAIYQGISANCRVETGLKENSTSRPLTVFPVPAGDYITVDMQENASSNLEIINILGASVMCIPYTPGKINISELPPGVYIVKLKTGTEFYSSRFVKN